MQKMFPFDDVIMWEQKHIDKIWAINYFWCRCLVYKFKDILIKGVLWVINVTQLGHLCWDTIKSLINHKAEGLWKKLAPFLMRLHQVLRYEIHRRKLFTHWTLSRMPASTLMHHYNDVIMSTRVSQITSLMIVYSAIYSGTDQRKHQSSMSLAFVREFTGDRWIPRTKGQ